MVNVAIIDNGLKEDIIKSSNILLRKIWCKKTKKQFAQEYHATICAKIIQEFSDNCKFRLTGALIPESAVHLF